MNKKNYLVPPYMWIPLALTMTMHVIAYNGTRIFTGGRFHFNLSTFLDDMIPTVPGFVTIYIGCYLFWIINYIIGCRQEKEEAYKFICADFFAKMICMIIFMILPTTNNRPLLIGDSVWYSALNVVYSLDAADNLFPSIHCLTSWLSFIAVRKNSTVPKWYSMVSLIVAVAICVSTLTTKQHVLFDVIGGVALAEVSYWFVEVSGFASLYRRKLEGRFYVQKN